MLCSKFSTVTKGITGIIGLAALPQKATGRQFHGALFLGWHVKVLDMYDLRCEDDMAVEDHGFLTPVILLTTL